MFVLNTLKIPLQLEEMVLSDHSTMTRQSHSLNRCFFGLTPKDLLSLIGSLLLPFMLGVFTIVITIHHQKVSVQQRLEDRHIAREQREQDLNISRDQRQHDLNMLARQREQDLNISREQREQDKRIADDRLRDAVLVAYLNDIANLLKDNNGTLTADPIVAIIARAKTLTTIRQLDNNRNAHLIQFLYEAKQLTSGANPLDLSDAELNDVNFTGNKNYHQNVHNLSLAGASLRNSSFSYLDLSNANFSGADLTNAQFDKTKLNNADMSHSTVVRASFFDSELINTNFTEVHSRRTSFMSVKALNATFTKGHMEFANFSTCDCKDVNFQGTQLEKGVFSKAKLHQTLFSGANLQHGDFSNAHVIGTNFKNARLRYSDFFSSRCEDAIFTKAELAEAHFVQAKLKEINFTNLDMHDVDFSGADLTLATFLNSKLDKAKFNGTTVVMTNFSFASMKKAHISDDQLFKALSIRGAILPNETVIDHDPNMLYNGHDNWQISPPGAIVISPKFNFPGNCLFTNQINNTSFMSQRANLTRYIPLTSRNRSILVLKARGGGNISFIRIDDHFDRLLTVGNFSKGSNLLTLRVQTRTHQPKVTVQFFGYGWCDDIELTVEIAPRIS